MANQRKPLDASDHERIRHAARVMREQVAVTRARAIEMRQRARAVRDMLAHQSDGGRSAVVEAAFDNLPTPAALVGEGGRIVATNKRWRDALDHRLSVGAGFAPSWLALDAEPFVAEAVDQALHGAAGTEIEAPMPGLPGRWGLVQVTPTTYRSSAALVVILDITEQHRREEKLLFDATRDALTGLANRLWMTREITEALERLRRFGQRFGLIYLDLDGFKAVNDTYGHAAGDELLRQVTARWNAIVRAPDLLARLGGDEFVVFVSHLDDVAELDVLSDRLSRALLEEFVIGPGHVHLSVSAGIAEPPPGATAETAIALADHAMYEAKRSVVPELTSRAWHADEAGGPRRD